MKNIKVIYPSDYFNKKEVDEAFKEESECFKNNGFFVTTIDSKNIEQGDVSESYSNVSEWYSSDRLYTQCSVENTYRYEFLGSCGLDADKFSYQMYRCRDEYYKPAIPELSLNIIDVKCINRTGEDGEPIDNIENYYTELKVENSYRNNGEECTVERQKSAFKEVNSQQCSSGYDRYTIYECK